MHSPLPFVPHGQGVGDGPGVGVADGAGVGVAEGAGVGLGTGVGVGAGVGVGLTVGEGDGPGDGVGAGPDGGATPALSAVRVVLNAGNVMFGPTRGTANLNVKLVMLTVTVPCAMSKSQL